MLESTATGGFRLFADVQFLEVTDSRRSCMHQTLSGHTAFSKLDTQSHAVRRARKMVGNGTPLLARSQQLKLGLSGVNYIKFQQMENKE